MRKEDCLGVDKNGTYQVTKAKFNVIAEDFQAGDALMVVDPSSKVIEGFYMGVYTADNTVEWYTSQN